MKPALAAFALLWSGAIAFATAEVWRTHGRRAAAVVGILLVLFARRYVGFVQSEGLGGPLGLVAFGLLWRAASRRRAGDGAWERPFAGGLLLLAMALLARPGPFTVLLALLLWGWRAAGRGRRGGRVVLAGLLAIGAALVVQVAVQRATTAGETFSDYPPIFYGLLHGEEHTYALRANPWIGDLPAAQQADAVARVALHEVGGAPWVLPVALLRCAASWIVLPQGLFGFVWLNPDDAVLEDKAVVDRAMHDHGLAGPVLHWVHELGAYSLANALVMALAGAAFVVVLGVAVVRARRLRTGDPHVGLVVTALAGAALSLPFLPPWITEGAQMNAAVIAFFFALPAVCLARVPAPEDDPPLPAGLPALAPVIAVATLAIVLVPVASPDRAPLAAVACAGDDGPLHAEIDRDAAATYGAAGQGTLRLEDVRRNLTMLARRNAPFATAIERTMSDATTIVPAYDACRERLLYLVDPDGRIGRTHGRWIRVEATPLDQPPLALVRDAHD